MSRWRVATKIMPLVENVAKILNLLEHRGSCANLQILFIEQQRHRQHWFHWFIWSDQSTRNSCLCLEVSHFPAPRFVFTRRRGEVLPKNRPKLRLSSLVLDSMPEKEKVCMTTDWAVKSIRITFYVQSFSLVRRHQSNCPPSMPLFFSSHCKEWE